MIFDRSFAAHLFDGNQATIPSTAPWQTIVRVGELYPPKQPIISSYSHGFRSMVAGATFTVPLPDGYAGTGYLQVFLRALGGQCEVVTTTPASTMLVHSTTTIPGDLCFTESLATLTVNNTSAVTVYVQYLVVLLPDISLEASFRGMQSTGAETIIT